MSEKELYIEGQLCTYKKKNETIEFICARCGKRKIAKKYGEYEIAGKTRKLCNGCYGLLISKQK